MYKELIEEARSSFKATNASASMIRRLADALEAATAELEATRVMTREEYARYYVESGRNAEVKKARNDASRWEYGFELIEPDDRNVFEREGDFISAAFAYRAAKKRIDEEHQADLPRLQYQIVRRRKAGLWLPVEGESK